MHRLVGELALPFGRQAGVERANGAGLSIVDALCSIDCGRMVWAMTGS